MNEKKNSVIRVALILMAVLSVVLAAVQIVRSGDEKPEDNPQADLSGYGESTPTDDYSGDLVYDDESTLEMDSIPNDAMTSGGDVSGADVSASDAEPADEGEDE